MNLNDTVLHFEIAKVGKGFVVRHGVSYNHPGASYTADTGHGVMYLQSEDELRCVLASFASRVK